MNQKKKSTANPTLVPAKAGVPEYTMSQAEFSDSKTLPATKTLFTKEMAARAVSTGADPHEFLRSIAVDPDLTFSDFKLEYNKETRRSELVEFERRATIDERIDCAKAILPYYVSKKPIEVAHGGAIQVLHSLAKTKLAEVVIDEQGKISEDAIEGEFDDLDLADGDE